MGANAIAVSNYDGTVSTDVDDDDADLGSAVALLSHPARRLLSSGESSDAAPNEKEPTAGRAPSLHSAGQHCRSFELRTCNWHTIFLNFMAKSDGRQDQNVSVARLIISLILSSVIGYRALF